MGQVTPKQLFKNFQCDSITVPSCDVHNGNKSGRDQAIIHGYFKSLLGYKDKLEPKVRKALLKAIHGFHYTKRSAVSAPLIKNPSEKLHGLPNLAFVTKESRTHNWIKQLSAAIILDATKYFNPSVPWNDLKVFFPEWIPADGPHGIDQDKAIELILRNKKIREDLNELSWEKGWSVSPKPYPQEIYRFRFHFGNKKFILCHVFLNRFFWYIWLPLDPEIKNLILNKIRP